MDWFAELEGHEFFLPVAPRFLKDPFNLTCLNQLNLSKARLAKCHALMYRKYGPTEEELQSEEFMSLNSDTCDMYGLIHARYIRSPEGK